MRSGWSKETVDDIQDNLARVSNGELASMSILPADVMMAIVAAENDRRVQHGEKAMTCKIIEVDEDQAHEKINPELIGQLAGLNEERVMLMVKGQSHYTTINFEFGKNGHTFDILDAARHGTSLPIFDILSNMEIPGNAESKFFQSGTIIGDPNDRYDKVQTGFKGCSAFSAYMAFEAAKIPDFHDVCVKASRADSMSQPAWSDLPAPLFRYAQSPKWWANYQSKNKHSSQDFLPAPGVTKQELESGIVGWVANQATQALEYLSNQSKQLAGEDPVDVDRRLIEHLKSETNVISVKPALSDGVSELNVRADAQSIDNSMALVAKLKEDTYSANPEACRELLSVMVDSGKLKEFLDGFYALGEIFRYLDHKPISQMLCTAIIEYLPDLINDSNSIPYCMGIAFPYLDASQRINIYDNLDHKKLSDDIGDRADLIDVVTNIPADKCEMLLQNLALQPGGKPFFKSAKEFADVLNDDQVQPDQCKAMIAGMKASSFQFANNDRLGDIAQHLHDDKRMHLEADLNANSTLALK